MPRAEALARHQNTTCLRPRLPRPRLFRATLTMLRCHACILQDLPSHYHVTSIGLCVHHRRRSAGKEGIQCPQTKQLAACFSIELLLAWSATFLGPHRKVRKHDSTQLGTKLGGKDTCLTAGLPLSPFLWGPKFRKCSVLLATTSWHTVCRSLLLWVPQYRVLQRKPKCQVGCAKQAPVLSRPLLCGPGIRQSKQQHS